MTGVPVTALTVVVGVVVFLGIFGSFVWCMKQWAEYIHENRSNGDDDSNLHAPLDSKNRKEWVRRLGVDGELFWYRDGSGEGVDVRYPGYVLQFKGSSPTAGDESQLKSEIMSTGEPTSEENAEIDIVVRDEAPQGTGGDGEPEKYFDDKGGAMPRAVAGRGLASSRAGRVEFGRPVSACLASLAGSKLFAVARYVAAGIHVRSSMRVNFINEAGVDAGGLQCEWFVLLNEKFADPSNGVFRCTSKADQTYYLNPNSLHDIGEQHLTYFFAAGQLLGRALLEGSVIGFHLALPLLKIILGVPITFTDLEHFDSELYRNLVWILENDGVEALGLDFSVTEKRGDDGEVVVVDLIPNGRSIDLTDENKEEYVQRRFRYVLFESVSSQLVAFLKGLYDVISPELFLIFDPEELDYFFCGSDVTNVDDWQRNTKYTSSLRGHPALIWFWELVREMPSEYRQRLLHFATGSSRVPVADFGSLTSYDGRLCPFTLKGVPLVDDGYIWSHACFNRLDLPLHVVRSEFRAVLYAAVETELYGFTTN